MDGRFSVLSPKEMSDYDSSGQDTPSSDSEESFENDLGNQSQRLVGNLRQQNSSIDGAANAASFKEKKPVPADLEDLLRAPLHKDGEKRQKQFSGAHLQAGSFAVNRLRNTCLTSDDSVVLVGASYSLPGTSILEPSFGDAEHSTVESSDKSMERPAGEKECLEAESWQQQEDGITASSQWLCEHYQRHCSVKFPCCMQFYSCHHCHNISTACDNEEAKACHATHLKCSYCQHEQEICEGGARCQKCGREMSAFFCFICKHFTSLDENPYHCEECGICWIHKDKSFHRDVCNVCLDKRLGGNHKCRPDSSHDEFCICLEGAFSGCQILPCSHKGHRGSTNVAVTQSGIEDHNHGFCLCERCTSSREDKGVSTENQQILSAPLPSLNSHSSYSDEGCVECEDNPSNHLEDLLDNLHVQTVSLDGSSVVEKKSIPVDLENPAEATLLTDKEKHSMQCYGAHQQENKLGSTMSDGVLVGASLPSTSFFEPHLGDFEHSSVSVLHNSDHKSSDNSLLALERCVAEASAVIKHVLQEREEHEQFGRGTEAKQQLTEEQRTRGGEEREERELGYTQRKDASDALTQNGIQNHNHGPCLCEKCTLTREDENKEMSPELPSAESHQSSTQSRVDFDDNCAQSQTHQSFDAFFENFSEHKSSSLSYWSEAGSNYNEENQHILHAPLDSFPEGLAPNFLARHTQDKGLYEVALSEISQQNDIQSQLTPPSYMDPVPGIVFGSQRANSFCGDVGQNASDTHLGTELPSYESSSDWDRLGARPRQSSVSPNSQSQQYWNRLGARPREHQYSTSATLPSYPQQDDDLACPEAGINSAFLIKHSTDQALLLEEECVQLGTRIKRKEKTVQKVPVQNCVNCNEIIDAQQQESHLCHPDKCCICQEYMDDFIGCYEVKCGHKFHNECYLNMRHNNIDTCPLCRQPI